MNHCQRSLAFLIPLASVLNMGAIDTYVICSIVSGQRNQEPSFDGRCLINCSCSVSSRWRGLITTHLILMQSITPSSLHINGFNRRTHFLGATDRSSHTMCSTSITNSEVRNTWIKLITKNINNIFGTLLIIACRNRSQLLRLTASYLFFEKYKLMTTRFYSHT